MKVDIVSSMQFPYDNTWNLCISSNWVSLLNVRIPFGTQQPEVSNYIFMQIYYWDEGQPME